MNNKGQVGLVFLVVFFVIALVAFSTIDPFKEQLDNNRDGTGKNTGLNCPGTPNHDATDYGNDTKFEKLVRRPTCFVTGISMVWFIGAVLIAGVVWVVRNWRGFK